MNKIPALKEDSYEFDLYECTGKLACECGETFYLDAQSEAEHCKCGKIYDLAYKIIVTNPPNPLTNSE